MGYDGRVEWIGVNCERRPSVGVVVGIVLLVFFALVFTLLVPLIRRGFGAGYVEPGIRDVRYVHRSQIYPGPQERDTFYPQQRYRRRSNQSGCGPIVAILVIAALLFVYTVIRWSVLVEAGIR
jgi:hypothetical protein